MSRRKAGLAKEASVISFLPGLEALHGAYWTCTTNFADADPRISIRQAVALQRIRGKIMFHYSKETSRHLITCSRLGFLMHLCQHRLGLVCKVAVLFTPT